MATRMGRLVRVVAGAGLAVALVAGMTGPIGAASPAGWSNTFSTVPGGRTKDTPAPVVFRGRLWVFARGTDNALRYARKKPGGWTAWAAIPGGRRSPSAPAAVVVGTQLHVFIRSGDNKVHRNRWNGTRWLGWTQVPGGMLTKSAPAATVKDGTLFLFVRRLDDTIQYITQTSGNWGAWAEHPGFGATDAAPAAEVDLDADQLLVVVNGALDDYLYDSNLTTIWTNWGQNSLSNTKTGAGLALFEGTIYLFQRNPDSSVSINAWSGFGWNGLGPINGVVTPSVPDAVQLGTKFWLFFRDNQNRIRYGIS